MKTCVAEIDGEAILAFRAADDDAAQRIISVKKSGFQVMIRGYSGLLRADGRVLRDGACSMRYRPASPQQHKQWLIVRNLLAESTDDPNDWVAYLVPVASIDDADRQRS
jgi:hypothetical protein